MRGLASRLPAPAELHRLGYLALRPAKPGLGHTWQRSLSDPGVELGSIAPSQVFGCWWSYSTRSRTVSTRSNGGSRAKPSDLHARLERRAMSSKPRRDPPRRPQAHGRSDPPCGLDWRQRAALRPRAGSRCPSPGTRTNARSGRWSLPPIRAQAGGSRGCPKGSRRRRCRAASRETGTKSAQFHRVAPPRSLSMAGWAEEHEWPMAQSSNRCRCSIPRSCDETPAPGRLPDGTSSSGGGKASHVATQRRRRADGRIAPRPPSAGPRRSTIPGCPIAPPPARGRSGGPDTW